MAQLHVIARRYAGKRLGSGFSRVFQQAWRNVIKSTGPVCFQFVEDLKDKCFAHLFKFKTRMRSIDFVSSLLPIFRVYNSKSLLHAFIGCGKKQEL